MDNFNYLTNLIEEKIKNCIDVRKLEHLSKSDIKEIVDKSDWFKLKKTTHFDELPKDIIGEIVKACEPQMKIEFEYINDRILMLKFNNDYVTGEIFMYVNEENSCVYYEYADIKTVMSYNKTDYYDYDYSGTYDQICFNIKNNININCIHNPGKVDVFDGYAKLIITPLQYLNPLTKFIEKFNKNTKDNEIKSFYISKKGILKVKWHEN